VPMSNVSGGKRHPFTRSRSSADPTKNEELFQCGLVADPPLPRAAILHASLRFSAIRFARWQRARTRVPAVSLILRLAPLPGPPRAGSLKAATVSARSLIASAAIASDSAVCLSTSPRHAATDPRSISEWPQRHSDRPVRRSSTPRTAISGQRTSLSIAASPRAECRVTSIPRPMGPMTQRYWLCEPTFAALVVLHIAE
jgi:hypothetical protein